MSNARLYQEAIALEAINDLKSKDPAGRIKDLKDHSASITASTTRQKKLFLEITQFSELKKQPVCRLFDELIAIENELVKLLVLGEFQIQSVDCTEANLRVQLYYKQIIDFNNKYKLKDLKDKPLNDPACLKFAMSDKVLEYMALGVAFKQAILKAGDLNSSMQELIEKMDATLPEIYPLRKRLKTLINEADKLKSKETNENIVFYIDEIIKDEAQCSFDGIEIYLNCWTTDDKTPSKYYQYHRDDMLKGIEAFYSLPTEEVSDILILHDKFHDLRARLVQLQKNKAQSTTMQMTGNNAMLFTQPPAQPTTKQMSSQPQRHLVVFK